MDRTPDITIFSRALSQLSYRDILGHFWLLFKNLKEVRLPGIEPGSNRWQRSILAIGPQTLLFFFLVGEDYDGWLIGVVGLVVGWEEWKEWKEWKREEKWV